jgi:DNA mismatch endonuclease (patch repair protein)
MQAQRTRDTAPEIAVRRLLHAAGLRYRVDRAPLVGVRRRADIVFAPARVAVFIDGCFWHGCPTHGTTARANAAFWAEKIERNRERDRDTDQRLAEAGWAVVRAWEHQEPAEVAGTVARLVKERRPVVGRPPRS